MAFVRCKGPDGSEFTVDEGAVKALGVEVIDKEAVDINGRPLPVKENIHKGGSLPGKAASREELEAFAVESAGMSADDVAAFSSKAKLRDALTQATSEPTDQAVDDGTDADTGDSDSTSQEG